MILCKQCGNSNEDGDEFCGSCGSFLEWTGEKVAAEAPPPPPPAVEAPVEPERPGIVQRVKAAVGMEATGADVATEPAAPDLAAAAAAEAERRDAEARAAAAEAQRQADEARRAEEEARRRADEARRAEEEAHRRAEAEAQRRATIEQAAREAQRKEAQAAAEARAKAQTEAEAERAKAQAEAEAEQAKAEAERVEALRAAPPKAEADEAAAPPARTRAASSFGGGGTVQQPTAGPTGAEATAGAEAHDEAAAAKTRAEQEARIAAEKAAAAAARAKAEQEAAETKAKAEQEAAEAKAKAEAEEARAAEQAAARAAAEAEAARAADVARKAEEAARRAAALVAKPVAPPPRPPAPPPAFQPPAAPVTTPATGPVVPPVPVTQPVPAPAAQPAAQRPLVEQPAAVKPGAPKPRPAPVTPAAPSRTIEPGDLICGQCGEGNTPTRKFCRRCGTSLMAAAVAPPLPWWKRIFQRRKRVLAAGERPRHGPGGRSIARPSIAGKIVKWVVTLAVLAGVVVALGPYRNRLKDDFTTLRKRFFPHYTPVRPGAESASSSLPGHPATLAFDLDPSTYWATGAAANGVGTILTVTFQNRVDLGKVGITLGNQAAFPSEPRPTKLHVTFAGGSADLTLADTPDFQTLGLNAKQVTTVQMTIEQVATSATAGHNAAVAEIEFYART